MRPTRQNVLSGIVLSAVVAFGGACGSKPAATCENAGAHIKDMMLNSDEMKKQPEDQQKAAMTMMDSLKEEMIKECKEKKWEAKQLDCIVSAKKMDDLEKCDIKK